MFFSAGIAEAALAHIPGCWCAAMLVLANYISSAINTWYDWATLLTDAILFVPRVNGLLPVARVTLRHQPIGFGIGFVSELSSSVFFYSMTLAGDLAASVDFRCESVPAYISIGSDGSGVSK